MVRRRWATLVLALIVALGLLPLSPASAARNRPPRIKRAVMKDVNNDGRADRVVLTYNERINHRVDKSRFPFRVQGYRVLRVNKARRALKLVILVKPTAKAKARPDFVRYARTRMQPVKDLKGLQAAKQLLTKNIIGLTLTPPPPPPGTQTLTVDTSGSTGAGVVTSDPAGINCGSTCEANFADGRDVTLTATPDAATKATFGGWTGCASSTPTCVVKMDAAKKVKANFVKAGTFTLAVSKTGSGLGSVKSTSNPVQTSQIDCGATCTATYPSAAVVTLTAARDDASGSLFTGWSGDGCTGSSTTCNVTMDKARYVTATFDKPGSFLLTVTKSGTGDVTSTSAPAQASQINCGSSCTATYPAAAQVTLTAAPQQGSGASFAGWSGGGCTGTSSTCTITMDAAKTVNATFGAPAQRSLTVTKAGDGNGTVTSSSSPSQASQVDCGATCQVSYPDQSTVTLTATAAADSVFAGWSGGPCTGTSPTCNVTMDGAKTVTATFDPKPANTTFALTVTPTNATVTCAPLPTSATGCNGSYAAGTAVTITAVPTELGAPTFAWVGCTPGALPNTCTVTMDADRTVTVSVTTTLGLAAFSQ